MPAARDVGGVKTVKVKAHTRTIKPRVPVAPAAKAFVSQGASVAKQAYQAEPLAARKADLAVAKAHEGGVRKAVIAQAGKGQFKSNQEAMHAYLARKRTTAGESLILGLHGDRTSAHTREHNRLNAPGRTYAQSTMTPLSIDKQPTKAFTGFKQYQAAALKGKAPKAEVAKAQSLPGVKPAWFKGASAGTLFAVQQLLRPSAALGAAQLNRSAKGGSNITSRAAAAWKGFKHPDQHAGDWVKAAKAQHWPVPVVTGTAASIAGDPTTYIAPGFGSAAKEAALHAYSDAIAQGAERHIAVAAARKVWEEAPAHTKVPGVHLKASGGVPFSRKLRFNVRTGTANVPGRVKQGLGKVGVKTVTPGGNSVRNAVRSVMPSIRPGGMDPVTHHFVRQAGVEGRAGERAAQRHAEHRLHAYDKALKGIPEERQLKIRVALQDTPHVADEMQRHLVFEKHGLTDHEQAVAHEMANERRVQYAAEPDRVPLTADSRVGHVAAPHAPAIQPFDVAATARELSSARAARHAAERTGTPADLRAEVEKARNAVKTAHKKLGEAHGRRAMQELHTGGNAVESLGQTVARAKLGEAQLRLKAAAADARAGTTAERHTARVTAQDRLKAAQDAHKLEVATARAGRKAYRDHIKNVQSYITAPKGYVHTPLKPEVLEPTHAARQATGRGAKVGSYSYQRQGGGHLANMAPEALANRELRIPVTQAHRALEHGRIKTAENVNNWIAALGRSVSHSDAAQMVGSKARLFSKDARGFTPLFDKYGKVDAAALNAATRSGAPIVHVDEGVDESVRQLARGNKNPVNQDALSLVGEGDQKNAGGVFDRATRSMKFGQTQVNPSYHIRNLVGDTFNALIAGTTGADFARSARMLHTHHAMRKLERVLSTSPEGRAARDSLAKANSRIRSYAGVPGGKASDAQVLALASKHGAIDTGLNAGELQAVRQGTDVKNLGKYQRAKSTLGRASDSRENFVRLATFQGALERGMTPEAAARWSLDHHFDYADLSHGEQVFARRVFPFWTFMARNTPLQVKSLATRPMIAGNVEKIRRGTFTASGIPQNAASGMEPFEQTNTPWGTGLKTKVGPITAAPALPTMDLSNIPMGTSRAAVSQFGGNILGRMHPALGTGLIGLGLGKNPLNLRDVPQWVPAPKWWPADAPGFAQSHMEPDPHTGQMRRVISGKLAMVLNILPPVSVAAKLGTPSAAGQGPSPALLRGAGWALGPRLAVENPHQRRITQLYDRVDQINAEILRIKGRSTKNAKGQWPKGSKMRQLLDEQADKQARIYVESKAMGTKNPLGRKRGKGRRPAPTKIGSFGGAKSLGTPGGARIGGFGQ